jgi:hypothetical protein
MVAPNVQKKEKRPARSEQIINAGRRNRHGAIVDICHIPESSKINDKEMMGGSRVMTHESPGPIVPWPECTIPDCGQARGLSRTVSTLQRLGTD